MYVTDYSSDKLQKGVIEGNLMGLLVEPMKRLVKHLQGIIFSKQNLNVFVLMG